jgi:2,4-dienoyl-CoA reductase (NADPH2)
MSPYSRLFAPFARGRLATTSRLVILPHGTAMVREGNLTEDDIAYYEARTRGGVGMVITGAAIASPSSALRVRNLIEAWDERTRDMLGRRARAVQRNGAKMICQILHLGREFTGGDSEHPPAAPSPVRSPRDPYPPHELGEAEIRAVIADFARSAENIVKSGCDGVELHAAHGYLFAQFLSPAVNKRSDRWGGTAENRLRFLLETVEAVRVRAGSGFILGVRLSADEETPDGLGVRDTVGIGQALAATGAVDYLSITIGMRGAYVKDATWPEAPAAAAAGIVRRESGLPVIVGQKILSPEKAEQLLAEGVADLVGAARAFIADPGFGEKAASSRSHRIRPCIGLNQDCRAFMPHLHCAVSPETGRETRPDFAPLTRSEAGKRVAVIGGGPAGMEAARVAAIRGHRVSLFEASDVLGGQFLLAASLPNRGQLQRIINHLAGELRHEGVRIELTARIVGARDLAGFDAVVVATGASALPLPETRAGSATRSWFDILSNGSPSPFGGGRAIFADDGGGFWFTYGVAEMLAVAGWRVTLATPSAMIGANVPHESVGPLLVRLGRAGTSYRLLTAAHRSSDAAVTFTNLASGEDETVPCDLLVVQTGRAVNPNPLAGLEGVPVMQIGDCVAPRRISHAILEGNKAGRAL